METDWHCIRFTQTVGWRPRDRDDDEFIDYAGVVRWCERRGILDAFTAAELLAQATRRPEDAAQALEDARTLRALLYHMLGRLARGVPVDGGQVAELNAHLARFLPDRRLEQARSGITWGWKSDSYRLDLPLAHVVWSAAELLTSPEVVARLRLCDADDCGWLFIDASRNHSRRWCDMTDCGNRAKARRFRMRQRKGRRGARGR